MIHTMAKGGTVADFHGSGGFVLRIKQDLEKINQELSELRQKNATLEAEVFLPLFLFFIFLFFFCAFSLVSFFFGTISLINR